MNIYKFSEMQDMFARLRGQNIVIWGAALKGKYIWKWLRRSGMEAQVRCFVDKDTEKQKNKLYGKDISSPDMIATLDQQWTILIASAYISEIENEIKHLNKEVRIEDVSLYCIPSRMEETFGIYGKDKQYVLLEDLENQDAVGYFEKYNIHISDTVKASQLPAKNETSNIIYIITGSDHVDIEQALIQKGYRYNVDYVVLTDLFYKYYNFTKGNKKVWPVDCGSLGDKHMEEYFCPLPFTQLYLYEFNSDICSPTWNNQRNTGNPQKYTIDEIWNSPMAQTIRSSVLSGSFCFCNEEMCWRLLEGKVFKKSEITDPKWLDIIENNRLTIDGGPEFLNIGYNTACNLKCKMCRGEVITSSNQEHIKRSIEQLKDYNFRNLKRLVIPGNGELFFDSDYLDILLHIDEYQFPALEAIWIYSNGLLFNEENWNKIEFLSERYKLKIFISTDAATEETYKKIRGGNYRTLLQNLRMLAEKRKEKKISSLLLPFCVQKENFREMVDFVRFAGELGADCVHFERLFQNPIGECVHRPENVYFEEFLVQLKEAIATGRELGVEIDYKPFKKLI